MRILITGITGFVGGFLARDLSSRGHEVWGTHFPHTRPLPPGVDKKRLRLCDLLDEECVWEFLREARPEAVFHLAALSFVQESLQYPVRAYETNLLGTVRLYEGLLRLGGCGRVLFIGSGDVYGRPRFRRAPLAGAKVNEEAPFLPQNPYSASKAAADLASYEAFRSRNLPVVRVRPFNHTGPGQSDRFVVSEFAHLIAQIEAGKHPSVIKVGNLRAKRDFSDVRDVVRAYRLLLWKGEPGEAYNVCSGRVRTIGEVLRALLSMTRAKIEVEVDPAKFRPADEDFLPGSFAKLKRLTGWTVRIPFRKTLADVLNYWRKIERPRSHRGEKGD